MSSFAPPLATGHTTTVVEEVSQRRPGSPSRPSAQSEPISLPPPPPKQSFIDDLQWFDKAIEEHIWERWQDVFKRIDQLLVEDLRKSKLKFRPVSMRPMVLGADEDSAKPWLVVFCHSSYKKRISRFFRRKDVIQHLRPSVPSIYDFHERVVDQGPSLRRCSDHVEFDVTNWQSQAHTPLTTCGMRIRSHTGNTGVHGGLVKVTRWDGSYRILGMTASHLMDTLGEDDLDSEPTSDGDNDEDDDIDENDIDDNNEDNDERDSNHHLFAYTKDSPSDEEVKILGFEEQFHQINATEEISTSTRTSSFAAPELPCSGINIPNAFVDIPQLTATQAKWPRLGSVLARATTYDCALYDIAVAQAMLPNRLSGSHLDEEAVQDLVASTEALCFPAVKSVAMAGQDNLKHGRLSASPSKIMLDLERGFIDTYTLQLYEDILDGDSGTWIVDDFNSTVYGHLVASDLTGDGYVMPVHRTFQDLRSVFPDARSLELPTTVEVLHERSKLLPIGQDRQWYDLLLLQPSPPSPDTGVHRDVDYNSADDLGKVVTTREFGLVESGEWDVASTRLVDVDSKDAASITANINRAQRAEKIADSGRPSNRQQTSVSHLSPPSQSTWSIQDPKVRWELLKYRGKHKTVFERTGLRNLDVIAMSLSLTHVCAASRHRPFRRVAESNGPETRELSPHSQTGTCLICVGAQKPRIFQELHVTHSVFAQATLFRHQSAPWLDFTRRWQTIEFMELAGWAGEIKEIKVTQVAFGKVLGSTLNFFVSVYESTDRIKHRLEWSSNEQLEEHSSQPYTIVDVSAAVKTIGKFIDTNLEDYLIPMLGDKAVRAVVSVALTHMRSAKTYREREILSKVFRLWVCCRMTSYPWHLVGDETLGIGEIMDENSPFRGARLLTPMIDAQIACIHQAMFLEPLSRNILGGLTELLEEPGQEEYWLTIFLSAFLLLHNISRILRTDEEIARQWNLASRFANPEAMFGLQRSAISLLYYWHRLSRTMQPFKRKMFGSEGLSVLPGVRKDQYDSLQAIVDWANKDSKITRRKKQEQTLQIGHDHYWILQLFDEDWRPSPATAENFDVEIE